SAQVGGGTEELGALRTLTLAVLAPALTAAAPAAAHQAILDRLIQVRQARLVRRTLTAGVSDPMHWLAMLILGILTQIAVAVVQLERLRPQALALFMFTTAFAATVVRAFRATVLGWGDRSRDSPRCGGIAHAVEYKPTAALSEALRRPQSVSACGKALTLVEIKSQRPAHGLGHHRHMGISGVVESHHDARARLLEFRDL